MADLYDITPPISTDLAVWPGDTPMSREVLCELEKGDSVTLSTLRATVHLGAHADGPNHYGSDGRSVGEQNLEYYLGRCLVIHVNATPGNRVTVDAFEYAISNLRSDSSDSPSEISDLQSEIRPLPPRVLIATGTYPDPTNFSEDFAGLAPELVDHLHGRGVILIGTDAPSVDSFDSKDLPAHKRFLAHDMAILETLALAQVPTGEYELIALPLKLMGFDASPVRAVLRSL